MSLKLRLTIGASRLLYSQSGFIFGVRAVTLPLDRDGNAGRSGLLAGLGLYWFHPLAVWSSSLCCNKTTSMHNERSTDNITTANPQRFYKYLL